MIKEVKLKVKIKYKSINPIICFPFSHERGHSKCLVCHKVKNKAYANGKNQTMGDVPFEVSMIDDILNVKINYIVEAFGKKDLRVKMSVKILNIPTVLVLTNLTRMKKQS